MKKILFRADGNAQIGLGHVMRCLALAEIVGPDYDRQFAIVQPSAAVTRLIEKTGATVLTLPTDAVTDLLPLLGPDTVAVLDGYNFDADYQRIVREHARSLVYIDDLVSGRQVADVVINHAGDLTADRYEAELYTYLLLGPKFALVNPAFVSRPQPRPDAPVFVNLGGADPLNLTHTLVSGLLAESDHRLTVVLGAANPHRATFADFPTDRVKLLVNLSAKQMARAMSGCRVAVVACSTISYEICTVGRSFVGIQHADNQLPLASFLQNHRLALDVLTHPIDIDRLLTTLTRGRFTTAVFNQRLYFDGKAPDRFRALFAELCG
jgi:UDP-2,4-diacetamido-2,4,6-trideoxy-beta-L-altropyranose hydrolase